MLDRLVRQKKSRRALWIARANTPVRLAGALDQAVLRFLRTRNHEPAVEKPMQALGLSGEYGAVWVATGLVGAATDRERRLRWLAATGVAPAAIILNFAVKRAVGRQRPVISEHPPLAKAPTKLSFPSAHATSSMAAAGALGRVNPKAKVPLHVLAALICVGRPYLGMHYPSDVVAGAALGAVLGRAIPWLDEPELNPELPRPSDGPTRSDRGSEEPSTSESSATSESRGPGRNL